MSPPLRSRWSWAMLEAAPHRLAFFLAMLVVATSGAWWATVQLDRVVGLGLPYDVSPSVVHSTLMAFGFMPLFFSGFLFTAGPKWLGVAPPSAHDILAPLLLVTIGWLTWPFAAQWRAEAAAASLVLVLAGLGAVTLRFWRLVLASAAPDRVHAKCIASALVAGCACLAGVAVGVLKEDPQLARTFVHTGLWAFVVAVYVTVAHRMIPFFTSSALPLVKAWRPFWMLRVLLGVAVFEAAGAWIDNATQAAAWLAVRGTVELLAGATVVGLAFAWGLVQSLKVRLVAMLHIGFTWLGIGLALSGVSHFVQAITDEEWLPLAGLHAITMGCLGSLMVAMVTRVSCGHSGRALVADNFVWSLFWMLQVATVLRITAAAPLDEAMKFTLAAAVTWAVVLTLWAVRYANWYGRPRADGRPG